MAGNKIILTCGHCGNRTAFAVAAEGFRPDTFDANDAETTTWRTWRVLLCSTCSQPTLEQDVQTVSGGHMGAHLTDEEILPEDVPVIIDFVETSL